MSADMMVGTARDTATLDPVIAPDLPIAAHVRSNSDFSAHRSPPSQLNLNRPRSADSTKMNNSATGTLLQAPARPIDSELASGPSQPSFFVAQLAKAALHTNPNDIEPSIAALSQSSVASAPITPYKPDNESFAPVQGSGSQYYDGTSSVAAESDAHRIQAFAKLEFEDGQFYMNTYAIELGRDSRGEKTSARQNAIDRARGENPQSAGERDFEAASNSQVKREQILQNGDSVVSGQGGIMGYDPRPEDIARRKKLSRRSSKRSRSSTSSGHKTSVRESTSLSRPRTGLHTQTITPQVDSTAGSHPVNAASLLPSPDECPLIGIHPPAPVGGISSYKSISRRHARIAFNFEKHLFEVKILGRNGAFVDEVWYPHLEVRPLKSGSIIQIGVVSFKFILPDVALGQTGGHPSGDGDDVFNDADTSSDQEEDEEEEEDEEGEEEEEESDEPLPPPPPIKRGPGRPPKNGIMSKRREKELAKQAAEAARANPNYPNVKGKTRPNQIAPPVKPEKRKYTKRKSPIGEDGKPVKEKKPPKPPKPPRSPSPEFDRDKLTPEQLAKPPHSYVVLIYEALSNSPTGAMSLPQIYRAIMRQYPYFKVTCETLGWQSSVRHNLSQHDAFRKITRDGKGWMWGIVDGIGIEKEKRRRASPPRPRPLPAPGGHAHYSNGAQASPGISGTYQSPYAPTVQARSGPDQTNTQSPNPHLQRPLSSKQSQSFQDPTSLVQNPTSTSNLHIESSRTANTTQQQSRPQIINRTNSQPRLSPAVSSGPAPHRATSGPAPPSRNTPSNTTPHPLPPATPELIKAFEVFKANMLSRFPKTARSEALINSAIDRALGHTTRSSVTAEGKPDDPLESAVLAGALNLLRQNVTAGSGARAGSAAAINGNGAPSTERAAGASTPGSGTPRVTPGPASSGLNPSTAAQGKSSRTSVSPIPPAPPAVATDKESKPSTSGAVTGGKRALEDDEKKEATLDEPDQNPGRRESKRLRGAAGH